MACASLGTPCEALAGIQVIARSGDDSPDGNGDMSTFFAPSVNSAGQVAFGAQLTGTSGGASDNSAMYRRNNDNTTTLISRLGQTVDGKNVVAYFPPSSYIDNSGRVGTVLGIGSSPVLFPHVFGSGGALSSIVPPSMPSPSGQSNALLGYPNSATMNASGVAVYRAVFTGAQNEAGLYQRAANGTHSVRLLQNTAAPRGGTITSTGGRQTLNELNQIGALLTIGSSPNAIRSAARIDGTTVHELAREGDAIGDGITIGEFRSSSGFVNAAGKVAFAADYTQNLALRTGVFVADTSATMLVAGGFLPGGSSLATNIQLGGISDTGHVAFATEFVGGSDPASGVYVADSSGPTLIAFEDTATPVAGKFFRSFPSEGIVMSDTGRVAFLAELSDTANGAAAGRGIYLYDAASGLRQIARTGDSLQGSTITSVAFTGMTSLFGSIAPDLSFSGLNNAGQVAFAFTLADGTGGVAIWSPSAGLTGDYNGNGTVDAADYVVWREMLNQVGPNLAADGNGNGSVGPEDYDLWRGNYGQSNGSASGATVEPAERAAGNTIHALPEPTAWIMLTIVLTAQAWGCCFRAR